MDKKNGALKYKITVLILIIILLLLIFFIVTRLRHKELPGNEVPDIFEISIDGSCTDETINDNTNNPSNQIKPEKSKKHSFIEDTTKSTIVPSSNKSSLPVYDEDTDAETTEEVFVDDKNGSYIYQQNLRIFNNSYFDYRNVIAPGVSGTYNFKVHNNSNVKLDYKFEMYETSDYSINLKYRLLRNGEYIIGDNNSWVNLSSLVTTFNDLNPNKYDSYSLNWKWDYNHGNDEYDTEIGENMVGEYKLNIRFYFEQDI